jgi:hypothetical protein
MVVVPSKQRIQETQQEKNKEKITAFGKFCKS